MNFKDIKKLPLIVNIISGLIFLNSLCLVFGLIFSLFNKNFAIAFIRDAETGAWDVLIAAGLTFTAWNLLKLRVWALNLISALLAIGIVISVVRIFVTRANIIDGIISISIYGLVYYYLRRPHVLRKFIREKD